MLDIKLIRDNVEEVIRRLNTRGGDFSYLRDLKAKDERKRELLVEVENLKSERNQKSKLIGEIKRNKGNADEVMAYRWWNKRIRNRINTIRCRYTKYVINYT